MSEDTQRKAVEHTFRRLLGPDPEARKRIADANEAAEWTVRCWKCKTPQTVRLSEIGTCVACGADLKTRS